VELDSGAKGNLNHELLIGVTEEVALAVNHVPGGVLAVLVKAVHLLPLNVLIQVTLETVKQGCEDSFTQKKNNILSPPSPATIKMEDEEGGGGGRREGGRS